LNSLPLGCVTCIVFQNALGFFVTAVSYARKTFYDIDLGTVL